MRQGFDVKCARGTLARILAVKVSGIPGRGRVEEPHGSSGPGTNTKCDFSSIDRYSGEDKRSASASKCSKIGAIQDPMSRYMQLHIPV